MTDVLIKGENLDKHRGNIIRRDTERTPCEDRRFRVMHLQAKKHQRLLAKPPEAQKKAWNRFSLPALKRNQFSQHVDFGLPVSRIIRQ